MLGAGFTTDVSCVRAPFNIVILSISCRACLLSVSRIAGFFPVGIRRVITALYSIRVTLLLLLSLFVVIRMTLVGVDVSWNAVSGWNAMSAGMFAVNNGGLFYNE